MNAANLVSQWNSVSFTPTTTTLTLTPPAGYTLSNIPHGQPVNIAVSVSPSASTGDVSLLGGPAGYNASCASTPCNLGIDFATLSGGSVSGTTTLLPGGTYNVTARYAGDGTHAASTSSPVQVTVAAENSKTFLQLADGRLQWEYHLCHLRVFCLWEHHQVVPAFFTVNIGWS